MASLMLPQAPVFWAQRCPGRPCSAVCSPALPNHSRTIRSSDYGVLERCQILGWPVSNRRDLIVVASQAGGGPKKPPMKKKVKKLVDINGDVTKDLGNGMFQIKLDNGVSVMAYLSGKIQQNRIKIVMGDKVTVELSPYDLTKGRITYRFRPGELAAMAAAADRDSGSSAPQ